MAPKNAWAHYLRASIELQAGRVEEATRYACKAAHLRPDLPMLKSGAGSLLMKTKDYEGALAQYEAAIEIDPSNASFHLGGEFTSWEYVRLLRSERRKAPGFRVVSMYTPQHGASGAGSPLAS